MTKEQDKDHCPYCGKRLLWKSNHITRTHILKSKIQSRQRTDEDVLVKSGVKSSINPADTKIQEEKK